MTRRLIEWVVSVACIVGIGWLCYSDGFRHGRVDGWSDGFNSVEAQHIRVDNLTDGWQSDKITIFIDIAEPSTQNDTNPNISAQFRALLAVKIDTIDFNDPDLLEPYAIDKSGNLLHHTPSGWKQVGPAKSVTLP